MSISDKLEINEESVPNIEEESFEDEDNSYSSDNTNTQQPLSNKKIVLQVRRAIYNSFEHY
ncbi:11660_t:CDS:2 [Gigaspora margarita]|uniref:11660_t:CDS:1 n=1 Tax=Gigaspora margarita TaxID=4874 RepID=A0ABN7VMR4_GIGMA|nr:11660_t:CDS:2 [Gigaspora margarita]